MSTKFYLRLLEPATDSSLYTLAYAWRSSPKRHTQPDRMSFEDFTDPNALAIGLFNGELQAVYFLHETEPGDFQAHFTTRRDIPRETALLGARLVVEQLLTNGAVQIHAWVTERNTPLRRFLAELGFIDTAREQFLLQSDTDAGTLPNEHNQCSKTFVKYVLRG